MNNVWNPELLGINIPAISCWSSSIRLPLSRVSVKTLIHCHECQKPLDITTLFPWSFPSSLTAFDPNSANLNTVPDRLHAGERRRGMQGKTLVSTSTLLNVPHPSDKLLFRRHHVMGSVVFQCVLSPKMDEMVFDRLFHGLLLKNCASPLTHSQENKP